MTKIKIFFFVIMISLFSSKSNATYEKLAFDFSFNDLDGSEMRLSEFKDKVIIITNVARGDIVDDEALIDALNRRKVYAVGLDVYKGEPNLNPGYLKHKSAFILPHLGSATKETRTAMANLAIDNLEEFYKTGNCKNKVN